MLTHWHARAYHHASARTTSSTSSCPSMSSRNCRRKFTFRARNIPCSVAQCSQYFSSKSGLTRHINAAHQRPQSRSLPTPWLSGPETPSPSSLAFNDTIWTPPTSTEPLKAPSVTQRRGILTEIHPLLDGKPLPIRRNICSHLTTTNQGHLATQLDYMTFPRILHRLLDMIPLTGASVHSPRGPSSSLPTFSFAGIKCLPHSWTS